MKGRMVTLSKAGPSFDETGKIKAVGGVGAVLTWLHQSTPGHTWAFLPKEEGKLCAWTGTSETGVASFRMPAVPQGMERGWEHACHNVLWPANHKWQDKVRGTW